MKFFSNNIISLAIYDNLLLIGGYEIGKSEKDMRISAVSAANLDRDIYDQGIILDPEELKTILIDSLKEARPDRIEAQKVVFEIPEELTFHHTFLLNKNIPENQLDDAILLAIEKVLPYEINEVSWDTKVIPYSNTENLILFSAAPLDKVNSYYEFFLQCGLEPIEFSIRPDNLLRTIGEKHHPPTIILDLHEEFTSVLLVSGKRLLGLQQIDIGEKALKKSLKDHFEIDPKELDETLRKLTLLEMKIATSGIVEKFQEDLNVIMEKYEKILEETGELEDKNGKKTEIKTSKTSLQTKHLRKSFKTKNIAHHIEKKSNRSHLSQYDFLFTGNPRYFKILRSGLGRGSKLGKLTANIHEICNPKAVRLLDLFHFKAPKRKRLRKNSFGFTKKNPSKKKGLTFNSKILPIIQRIAPSIAGGAITFHQNLPAHRKPLNLLPQTVRKLSVLKETTGWFYILATIFLILSVSWLMAFGFSWGNTSAQLRISQQNLTYVERSFSNNVPLALGDKIIRANDELRELLSLKSNHIYANVFAAIQNVLPEEVSLQSLQYGLLPDNRTFEIKARAENRIIMLESYKAVKDLPFIQSITFPPSNYDKKEDDTFIIQFRLKSTSPETTP